MPDVQPVHDRPAPARRARRATRAAGTVGGDDTGLRSAHPAFVRPSEGADEVPQRPEVRPRTGDRAGDEASVLSDRSADDTDLGWGERRPDSNDDRLRQDKPPHW